MQMHLSISVVNLILSLCYWKRNDHGGRIELQLTFRLNHCIKVHGASSIPPEFHPVNKLPIRGKEKLSGCL